MNLIDIKKKMLQLTDLQLSDLHIKDMLNQLPHPTEGCRKLITALQEAMRPIQFKQFVLQLEKERKGLLCHAVYKSEWRLPLGCHTLQLKSLGGVIKLWRFPAIQYKACLYTQLKVCQLDIKVQILLSSNSKPIITGYAEARNESITCSEILRGMPSCDGGTILGELDQLPFDLSDKISKISLAIDITKKTLAVLGKYEGLASCILYLQLAKGATDKTQFVLGIDVPKDFKFGNISSALSFLDNKIAVHQAGLLIASLKGNTLTEVMNMFEESVSVLNGVGTYPNTEVLECNAEKSIQKLALDGIPDIWIPTSDSYELPLAPLKLKDTGFCSHTFSELFVLYGALNFNNSPGYIQNLKAISVQESYIPDVMLEMRVVIPKTGEKEKFIHFHGHLNSDINIVHNITVKEATIDIRIQGEKQIVSLSGTVTLCDIPGCDTQQTGDSQIKAKGELHLWKSFAVVHVHVGASSALSDKISHTDIGNFNFSGCKLCELRLFFNFLLKQDPFFELSLEAPLPGKLLKVRLLVENTNRVFTIQLNEENSLLDVFKLINEDWSMSILEDFMRPSGEIYFSSQEYKPSHFPSEPTDFIPPELENVLVVPKQVYHEGYHGVINARFFNKWTLQFVIDITKSGNIERISGQFPEPIEFLKYFSLVGSKLDSKSEVDTGPDVTYKDKSLTMTCGVTFLGKRQVTGQFSVVHQCDFHGIKASLTLDFLPAWISNREFSIAWSKENHWQFKIPVFGSVPTSLFNFAAIVKKALLWLFKLAVGGITFGVKFWATIGENIDPKKYFVTFRIHGYFYVEFLGFLKVPAIALPKEGIPLVIERVDLTKFRFSDIPELIMSNLITNAKLLVKYLWECIKEGNLLEHLGYMVKLAVNGVYSTVKEVCDIVKKGLGWIKKKFSTRSGSVKVVYCEREIGEILGGKKCQEFKNEKKITDRFGELAMLLGIAKISKVIHRSGKAHLATPEEVSHLSVDGKQDYEQGVNQLDLSSNDLAANVARIVEDELCISYIEVQINCTSVSMKWSMKNDEVLKSDDGDIEYEILLYVTSFDETSSELLTHPVIGPKPVSYALNGSGTNTLTKLGDQYFISIPLEISHPILYASVSIRASVTMIVRSLMEELRYTRRVSVTLLGSWHHVQQVCDEVLLPPEAEETCSIKSVAYDSGKMTITPTVDESLLSDESINYVQVVDQNNTSIVLARIALQSCSPKLSLNELPPNSKGPYQVQVVSITSERKVALYFSDKVIYRNPHPQNVQTLLPDRLQQGSQACTEAKWKVGQSESDSYNPHRCSYSIQNVVDSAEVCTCLYTLCCMQTLEINGKTGEVKHTLVSEKIKAGRHNEFKIHFNLQDAVKNHRCSEECDGTMFNKAKPLILQPSVITASDEHFLQSKPVKGPILHVFGPPKAINLFCPSKKADIEVWLKYADQSLSYQVEVIDGEGSIVHGPIIYHHKDFIMSAKSQTEYDRKLKSTDFQEEYDSKTQEAWDSKHQLKIHKLCPCLKENTKYKLQVFSVGYGDQYLMSIVPEIAPQSIQLLLLKMDYDPERDEVRVDFETSRYKATSYTVELFVFTEFGEDCLVSKNVESSPCIIPLHQCRIIPNGTIRALVKASDNTSASTSKQASSYFIGISEEKFSIMPNPYCTYKFSYVPTYQNYLLDKVHLEWYVQDNVPGFFIGITDYNSNEVIHKEKILNGQGLVGFFTNISILQSQLSDGPIQLSCFVQSIATPRRVNSNLQKSLPLQCIESKCLVNQDFIVFFSFHLNNLRNLYAETQTLRCFIPANALPKSLLVVLPTTSTGTVPKLPEACKPKLVNLFHEDSNGFLYVHVNSVLPEPVRIRWGILSNAKCYPEVFKSFPNGQKITGRIYIKCQASIGTEIKMTVKHEKKKKRSERKLFARKFFTKKKQVLRVTFSKHSEMKELDCSVLNISSSDHVSVTLEVSRFSSCQILNLLVIGRVVRW